MAVALALSAATTATATPARYELDPVHTRVLFAVSHAGFSQALGTLSGSHGTLEFDPHDWSGARLEVNVPLQQLDLGDTDWNRAVLARNLLDARRWPQAHFISTRVEPLGADRFLVHGQLTLRGVTREVPLEVSFNTLDRHPLPPFRRTAGFSASARLSRAAFGITAWPSTIGDTVELRIEAEALRRGSARGTGSDAIDADATDAGDDVPPASHAEDDDRDAQPATPPSVRQEPAPR